MPISPDETCAAARHRYRDTVIGGVLLATVGLLPAVPLETGNDLFTAQPVQEADLVGVWSRWPPPVGDGGGQQGEPVFHLAANGTCTVDSSGGAGREKKPGENRKWTGKWAFEFDESYVNTTKIKFTPDVQGDPTYSAQAFGGRAPYTLHVGPTADNGVTYWRHSDPTPDQVQWQFRRRVVLAGALLLVLQLLVFQTIASYTLNEPGAGRNAVYWATFLGIILIPLNVFAAAWVALPSVAWEMIFFVLILWPYLLAAFPCVISPILLVLIVAIQSTGIGCRHFVRWVRAGRG